MYGTTLHGGNVCGLVFKLDPAGNETVLHSFGKPPDGCQPIFGVTLDASGNLYGATSFGRSTRGVCGFEGCGIVYKVAPTGKETILYTFSGPDGDEPFLNLTFGPGGNLYGSTYAGGAELGGVVYKLSGVTEAVGVVPDTKQRD